MNTFAPEAVHNPQLHAAPKVLRFDVQRDFAAWQQEAAQKLRELLGDVPARVAINVRIEWRQEYADFEEIRFLFATEANADVPCHLLLPKSGRAPHPVVICLQGHTTGMHISLGRAQSEADEKLIRNGDRDFALQAVAQGYAALVMEQRCFGERKDARDAAVRHLSGTCHHASMTALLLGRTMIGERVWDVSRAIDALETFAEIDSNRVACMGNSGGGTITFFAACMEPRIQTAMPSCSVCTFADAIGSIDHCADNYIPSILKYFEMGDLAGLIAPRPLIIVAGREDNIFPIDAVQSTFALVQEIYTTAGVPNNCRLVVGDEGHRFYAAQSWPVFREVSTW
jgi:dienelactone hydrolase